MNRLHEHHLADMLSIPQHPTEAVRRRPWGTDATYVTLS